MCFSQSNTLFCFLNKNKPKKCKQNVFFIHVQFYKKQIACNIKIDLLQNRYEHNRYEHNRYEHNMATTSNTIISTFVFVAFKVLLHNTRCFNLSVMFSVSHYFIRWQFASTTSQQSPLVSHNHPWPAAITGQSQPPLASSCNWSVTFTLGQQPPHVSLATWSVLRLVGLMKPRNWSCDTACINLALISGLKSATGFVWIDFFPKSPNDSCEKRFIFNA